MLTWSGRAVRESWFTCWAARSWNSLRKLNFSQNSRPYILLKLLCNRHGYASSPAQCLFSISHSLHPCIILCLGYHAHTFLLFPVVTLLILSSTRYMCQLHLLGSLLVKAIYDKTSMYQINAKLLTHLNHSHILHYKKRVYLGMELVFRVQIKWKTIQHILSNTISLPTWQL